MATDDHRSASEVATKGVSTLPRLPLWMTIFALLLTCWNILNTFRGAVLGGISWDEPNHVSMLQGWFKTGYYAEAVWASTEKSPVFIFGPASDLIGHLLAVVLQVESWGNPSLTAPAYFARHLATAAMSACTIAAVVGIGRLVLGSWRWGILSGAMLSCIPMWSGLGMFDHKDVGPALGITVYALGLLVLIRPSRSAMSPWLLVSGALMCCGVVIAVGTRISTLVLLGVMTFVTLLLATRVAERSSNLRSALIKCSGWLGTVLVVGLLAYAMLLLIYPLVFAHPLATLLPSIRQSGDFQIYPYRPPRTYVPEWFALQTPTVIALAACVGVVMASVLVIRGALGRGSGAADAPRLAGLGTILVQGLAVPVYVVAVNAILYHSLRHVLFIFPAVALLATFAIWWVVRLVQSRSRTLSRAILGVALIGLLVPAIEQARLFPYGYAYFSPVARLVGIEGRWPTDYWRTSWRELYAQIPTNEFAVCPDTIHFPDDTMYGWPVDQSFSCAFETKVSPFFTEPPNYDVSTGHFWFLRENAGEIYIPKNCSLHSRVTRPLGFREITMGYLAYCDYVPTPGTTATSASS